MAGRAAVRHRVLLVAAMCLVCAFSHAALAQETDAEPAEEFCLGLGGLHVSPDGARVAFSVSGMSEMPDRVYILDSAGGLVARTNPSATPCQVDFPLGWSRDGQKLLIVRYTHGPEGSNERSCRCILLDAASGGQVATARPLNSVGWRKCAFTASGSAVFRVTDDVELGSGLCMATPDNGELRLTCVLPDTSENEWADCVFAEESGGALRLIVTARQPSKGSRASSIWEATVADGQATTKLLKQLGEIKDCVAWPDGEIVAAVTDAGLLRWLAVLTTATGELRLACLLCEGREVSPSPDGSRILVWDAGAPEENVDGYVAYLCVFDTSTLERWGNAPPEGTSSCGPDCCATLVHRGIALPDGIRFLEAAAWLTNDSLLLSDAGRGILRYDLRTGETSDFWRFPNGRTPHVDE